MFLEYAIWGAWYPVLAARLLGPLKFTGKQTGWIYATIRWAASFSPLFAGQIADRWINTEFILAGAHLAGHAAVVRRRLEEGIQVAVHGPAGLRALLCGHACRW